MLKRLQSLRRTLSRKHLHDSITSSASSSASSSTFAVTSSSSSSSSSTQPTFASKYECLDVLGVGKTSHVVRVRARHAPYFEGAAKIIAKSYLTTTERCAAAAEELAIVKRVRHEAIVDVFDVFDEPDQLVIVTERAYGGEVLGVICGDDAPVEKRAIASQPLPTFLERDAAAIVRTVLQVIAYLHAHGITHRDVKLDNILCRGAQFREGVVLIDFGLAHQHRAARKDQVSNQDDLNDMTGMNGTCHYMAPEMFGRNSKYGPAIDVWAVGIVAFVLLCGEFPFDAKFMSQIEDKIASGKFAIPDAMQDHVSDEAREFLHKVLVVNPKRRLSAAEALQLPWLQLGRGTVQHFSEERIQRLRRFYVASRGDAKSSLVANAQRALESADDGVLKLP